MLSVTYITRQANEWKVSLGKVQGGFTSAAILVGKSHSTKDVSNCIPNRNNCIVHFLNVT